jgi:quinol-cytochrome oxidoreductase complex cytochrome b subunit
VPDWTDFNESDPGITLLELFAWLASALLFALAFHAFRRRRRRSGHLP